MLRKRFFVNGKPVTGSTLHAEYLKPANVLLDAVKQRMKLDNLQQLAQRYITEDGATLTAMSRFGQDEIRIDVPQVSAGSVSQQSAPELVWTPRTGQYAQSRFLVATGPHGNIYQLDPDSLQLTLATDLVFEGCPGHIAATMGAIAITDNLADYYKYGTQEWEDRFAAQTVLHPKLRFYSRSWVEKPSYTPYTLYGEEFATASAYYGLTASQSNFQSLYSISRFWGWIVGNDVNYYYDLFDNSGIRTSHFDIFDWFGRALCHANGQTYAELIPDLYDAATNTYLPEENHFARMTPGGPEYTLQSLGIKSLAAMDGRIYGLYITNASTGQYAIGVFTERGELERSVDVPIYHFWTDETGIHNADGQFPFGRLAAGAGKVIAVNRPNSHTYVLHVFDRALNPVSEVPVPAPVGFGPEDVIFNGSVWPVLAGDFNTAIGFDPYYIPEFTIDEGVTASPA